MYPGEAGPRGDAVESVYFEITRAGAAHANRRDANASRGSANDCDAHRTPGACGLGRAPAHSG
ncbi:hypothetical protein WS70_07600 [Burkholderia mayonis]|uniref:Uncharacterized protein n=1 Tax=Burkholderia mayonis TaxID=1385591 RepID=A0A1B4FDG1_9BURK|nr:hypothetical protein WS70_07600 [Burkholderia mayonis]KVE40648.1 hypothetical protein WS69_28965 [Burkholderia sp. BDU5]KVE47433.1 hypothetical protein WS70_26815 [Burkholderia mayonis]